MFVLSLDYLLCKGNVGLTLGSGSAQLSTVKELQKKAKSMLRPNPLPGGHLIPAVAPEDDPEQILYRHFLYIAQAQTIMAIRSQFTLPWKQRADHLFYSQGEAHPLFGSPRS